MKHKTSFGGPRRGRPAPQGAKSDSKPFGRASGQRRREDGREDVREGKRKGGRSDVRSDGRSDDRKNRRDDRRGPVFKRGREKDIRDTERSYSPSGQKPYDKPDRQAVDFRRDRSSRDDKKRGMPPRDNQKPHHTWRADARDDARDDRGNRHRRDGRRDDHRRDDRQDFGRDRRPKAGYAKPSYDKPRRDNLHRDKARRDEPRHETYKGEGNLIWGLHAARAAWLNPQRRCYRLWLTEAGRASMEATLAEGVNALLKRPDMKLVERQELDRLTPPGTVHQGIVLDVAPLPEPVLGDLIAGDAPPEVLLMLDQVTDPHNVGAILRSAAAFGAGGVIMTERNAPGTTGVLAKSASGALEHVPQLHVVNLSRALDELQQAGYWCVGLAEEGERDIAALDLTGRTVLVMGAEGEGLRQLTRKKCNELARLPTGGAIGSLNVSNAAAVALYEWKRQKVVSGSK